MVVCSSVLVCQYRCILTNYRDIATSLMRRSSSLRFLPYSVPRFRPLTGLFVKLLHVIFGLVQGPLPLAPISSLIALNDPRRSAFHPCLLLADILLMIRSSLESKSSPSSPLPAHPSPPCPSRRSCFPICETHGPFAALRRGA